VRGPSPSSKADRIHYVALVIATLLTLTSGWCLSSRLSALSERVLATLVIAIAQIVATLLFAGLALRSFATATVLVVNLAVTAVAVLGTRRSDERRWRVAAEWRALRHGGVYTNRARDAWMLVLGALAVVVTGYLLIAIYALPSAAWDAMNYHLVAVGAWLRGDHILLTPLDLRANTSPMNGELTFLWIATLARSDIFIELPQLVFAGIGGFGTAMIARTVGVSRAGAIAAGLLYFLTPTVIAQATTNYVDLALPGLFLAGFAFLLRYLRSGGHVSRTRLAVAGVAIGVAAGAKTSGAMYAAVATIVLVANLLWWRRDGRVSWAAVGRALALFLAPVVALGSFWYVRTWVEYGTPTYPYVASVAGVQLFDGPVDLDHVNTPPEFVRDLPRPLRALGSWVRISRIVTYDQRLGGLGPAWLFLELPALVAFTVYCAARRRFLLWNFLLPIFAITALTPSNWWARFTVLIVAPGAVALAFFVERIRRRWVVVTLEGVTIVLVVAGLVQSSKRYAVLSHSFSVANVVSDARKPATDRTFGKLVLPEYEWVDHTPRDARIGVVPGDVPHRFISPLYGRDFRNDVIGLSRRDFTAQSLVPALRRARIDYLVTRKSSARDAVAREESSALDLVSSAGGMRVYRVRPQSGSRSR
jgi:hypothetical protein